MNSIEKHKKVYAAISLIVVLVIFGVITWVVWRGLSTVASTPEEFVDYVRSFGWAGFLVMLGIQVLQVFIALIPGEVVEIAAGFAFGAVGGTILCLVGVGIASVIVFLLVKRWGKPLVEVFIPSEKMNQLHFLNEEAKLKNILFLLYFIPGTPKDLLTYFAGLTKIRLGSFLGITLLARIPSIITSTAGGSFISNGDYLHAIVVFAITAIVSISGILIYNQIIKTRQRTHEKDQIKS